MEVLRGAPSALRFSKAFAMNITKDTAVTINYKITDKLGKLLDKGERAESPTRTIPNPEFPPGVKVGGQLRGTNDQGEPQIYHVVKIKGPVVLLDGNHPLAGMALRFDCKVTEVRAAKPEEIEHRHVHGGHGHHH
jgi:FKBP-type peptidyl-prolyl cis-trans isomerase SlyD